MRSHNSATRIGQHLVSRGVLTDGQVRTILHEQERSGRPFGWIAERRFGVDREAVRRAWSDQYAAMTPPCDLDREPVEAAATATLSRRQAWQMQLLPLRLEGGALVLATSKANLGRAATFAWRRLTMPIDLRVADPAQLRDHLARRYPWPGFRDRPVAMDTVATP